MSALNQEEDSSSHFVFPAWANYLLPLAIILGLGGALYVPVLAGMAGSPTTLNVGYRPKQPVPFSHELHAGQMGMDCRYCHNTVEHAAFAALPPTQTCINCHNPSDKASGVKKKSPQLQPVRESYATGKPVKWVRVHSLPNYVYFNHSAHVNHGVSCYTCHGRINKMGAKGVYQVHNLSMSWCLDCHRNPQKYLRPKDQVTSMTYHLGQGPGALKPREEETMAQAQLRVGKKLVKKYNIHSRKFMQSCSTCHR